jgi:hypothetical protein
MQLGSESNTAINERLKTTEGSVLEIWLGFYACWRQCARPTAVYDSVRNSFQLQDVLDALLLARRGTTIFEKMLWRAIMLGPKGSVLARRERVLV